MHKMDNEGFGPNLTQSVYGILEEKAKPWKKLDFQQNLKKKLFFLQK